MLPTPFTQHAGINVPIICGPMYPCSNPELVAAVSETGGIGIVQPLSLTYVHGYEFRDGLRKIFSLTSKPIGMNALIEQSSKTYKKRMSQWIDIALEEGIRFFITSLGKPDWVVDRVHAAGGRVYHDATERKWALKGLDSGVDGLIAVNNRAGGHAGAKSGQTLLDEFSDLGVPLICAGGISTENEFANALQQGYAGVQMGTRFIATHECDASEMYKAAIVHAQEKDIALSERITGVPVSVILTPDIIQSGLKAGPIAQWMLKQNRIKHYIRMFYMINSLRNLKHALHKKKRSHDYWQAGKSVAGITSIESAKTIVARFAASTSLPHE